MKNRKIVGIVGVICTMAVSASCLTLLNGCGKEPDIHGEGIQAGPLETNIIYNGNLSLYSFDRWPESKPANDRKRKTIISHINDLQGLGTREAIWTSYGTVKKIAYGDPFDFSVNDKVFNELKMAGLRYVLQMKVDAVVENPDNYGPIWEKNAVWYIKMVGRKYGSVPLYYVPMNEPDNEGQRPDGIAPLTTEQIVKVQKLVWETLKSIDPNINIASSPLCRLKENSTYTSSGEEVLRAGITEYCDYFAFHKHVDIGEDSAEPETLLWNVMDEAEKAGFPRRKAVLNENGTSLTLKLVYPEATEDECRRFKAYWIGNDLIQMKALGLKYIVMYSLAGSLSRDGEFNVIDLDTPESDGYKVHRQEYQAYADLWNPQAHSIAKGINGGFEEENPDKSRGWVVSFRGRSFNGVGRAEPKEWDYVNIVSTEQKSGARCLEMRPVDFIGTEPIDAKGITGNRCRRLVEGLIPGRRYRLSANIKVRPDNMNATGSLSKVAGYRASQKEPVATLRALGTDPYGRQKSYATVRLSDSENKYLHKEICFTAGNPWVVISLEHNASGYAYWDDVELLPAD